MISKEFLVGDSGIEGPTITAHKSLTGKEKHLSREVVHTKQNKGIRGNAEALREQGSPLIPQLTTELNTLHDERNELRATLYQLACYLTRSGGIEGAMKELGPERARLLADLVNDIEGVDCATPSHDMSDATT